MKRLIAILLAFSILLSLSGCYIDTDEIVDSVTDEISKEVDKAIDKTKEEVSNKVEDAKDEAANKFNEAVDDAKAEASQKMDDVLDGLKSETDHVLEGLPQQEGILELPQADETDKSWIENFEEGAKDGWDDFWGRDLTITFNPNGGRGGPKEQRFKANTYPSMPSADKNPTREGYHFVGWATEVNSEPQFFAGQKVQYLFIQSTTLYACWEKYNHDEPFAVQSCMGQTLKYGGVFELIGGAAGYQDIIIEHNYHLIKAGGNDIRIQCDCGFELVDRDLSLDNFVIIKSEGEMYTFDSLTKTQKKEYQQDYDLYCKGEVGVFPDAEKEVVELSNGTNADNNNSNEYIIYYSALGAINVPDTQTITDKLFSSKKLSDKVPVKKGYIFIGWATTEDATEASYQPGQKWDQQQSANLYAVWEECKNHGYILTEVVEDKFFTKEKEDIYVIECDYCLSPYPIDELTFAVFMEHYAPNKDINKLKEKKETEEVDAYIRTKVSMAAEQNRNFETHTNLVYENGDPKFFEIISLVAEGASDGTDIATLESFDSFFLLSTSLTVMAEDCGINNIPIQYLDGVGKLSNIASFSAFIGAAETARSVARKSEKQDRKEDIYFKRKDYGELMIANANSAAKLIKFLGDFCGFSTGVPLPDEDALLEKVSQLDETIQLARIYEVLIQPILKGGQEINYYLERDKQFLPVTSFDSKSVTKAMAAGPWAKDILALLTDPEIDILSKVENIQGSTDQELLNGMAGIKVNVKSSKEWVETALWYYYGWRMEYEYNTFLDWIYDNEVGSFQSYLMKQANINS